jgi:hypothetical protein
MPPFRACTAAPSVRFVLVTVVVIEMEVSDDAHRSIRERLEHISIKERVVDLFDNIKFELFGEMA